MKKLMKFAAMAVCVGTMLGITGCGSKSPDAVAVEFLQTMAAGKADMDYLQKHCTQEAASLFFMVGKEAAREMKGATFTVVDTKIDGDKAKVSIKQNGGAKPDSKPQNVDLVKVDGEWKVTVNKEEKEEKEETK